MRSSVLVFLAVLISFASAFKIEIVPEGDDCKVGQKFVNHENDQFVKECKAVDNGDTYYNIIGCRSEDKKFFALGTTYDLHKAEQLGFRLKCYLDKEGTYGISIEACLMGKKMKPVKKGQKGVIMNQACTCNGDNIDCR